MKRFDTFGKSNLINHNANSNTTNKQEIKLSKTLKLAPSYFIPNRSKVKGGKKIIDNNEVTAFVQTKKGRILFTPKGAFIGITVPKNPKEIERRRTNKKNSKMPIDQIENERGKDAKLIVIGLGFEGKNKGKSKSITPELEEKTKAKVNFLIGEKENWQRNIPTYRKLVYENVWDGIDVEYIGYMDKLEYRVILNPNANPDNIIMITGAEDLELTEEGNLIAELDGGKLYIGKPLAYQEIDGKRVDVKVSFKILSNGRYTFELGNYNPNYKLIIDPVLEWSTYVGGDREWDGERKNSITIDSSGNIYVCGYTESSNFPTTTGAYQTTFSDGYYDTFVFKLNSNGSDLIYSTYVGGSGADYAESIAIDFSGNVYVCGYIGSSDFPTTSNAYQTSNNGDYDALVFKLNSDGSDLVYSTYVGGSDNDRATSLSLDSSGNAYVCGFTQSSDFPTTTGAYQTTNNGGYDAFVFKLSSDGSSLVYSTYVGGIDGDFAYSLSLDSSGNTYVCGATLSGFPTTTGAYQTTNNGSYDAIVFKLNSDGSDLVYSTYVGGSDWELPNSIAVDSSHNAYVCGYTQSSDFPTTTDAYQITYNDGYEDGFVFKLNNDGSSLVYSTYIGGSKSDRATSIIIDSSHNAYVCGYTNSSDFPKTQGTYDSNIPHGYVAFVLKFNNKNTCTISASAGAGGTISPSGNVTVNVGDDITFTISANSGYHIKDVLVDGSSVGAVSSYTFQRVTSNHSIEAQFEANSQITYSITATAGTGGTINPSGNVTVNEGVDISFTISANSGYHIKDVLVDGSSVGAVSTYTFQNVTSNHTIEAQFEANSQITYSITATAGTGGTINPSGNVIVNERRNITFTISANSGYHIKDVLVDGSSVGAVSTYTFQNVTSNHTIEAQFEANSQITYSITATAGTGGTINPSGDITVNYGDDVTFTITPDSGNFIEDVTVDGHSVGRVQTYTFYNVHSDHKIHAVFTDTLPPTITSAKAQSLRGQLPLKVNFTCNAYDPDGGAIVRYIWHIDGDDFSDTVVTFDGLCNYMFVKPDTYHISVTVIDDEGESASVVLKDFTNEDTTIVVENPQHFNLVMPLPVVSIGKSANSSKDINIHNIVTSILNLTNEKSHISIKYFDANGNNVLTYRYTIAPGEKFSLNPNSNGYTDYNQAKIESDSYFIAYSKVMTATGQMTSYLLPQMSDKLFIPHVAEETDYWDTSMFISSLESTDVKVKVGENENTYNIPVFSQLINLEDLLGDDVNEAKTWGTVESIQNNPFEDTQPLGGFEVFQHNETDGAAIELQSSGSRTLFIPHIPEETDIFWTGFAIVNPNDEDANIVVDLYTKDGEQVASIPMTIEANTKLKALASDLFGEANGSAEWGIIRSDKDIIGMEIYGTVANGICGFALPSLATTEGYLPELITGDNYWNGIAITNPSNETATVDISLISKDGIVKDTKQIELQSMARYKSVVKDLFADVEIESTDYIYYKSTISVIAISVSGDLDRTFMFSLVGRE
ncbi:SBBP repeat-containing protein [Thermotomaculum hydrothermale]|nr:SBBP repeat-containing protein [Thermotomaculum hydrothermale]